MDGSITNWGVTKWSVLESRLMRLREDAAKIEAELAGMTVTEFGQPCTGCGEVLATEADFARHFVLYSVAQLNVGRCPHVRV